MIYKGYLPHVTPEPMKPKEKSKVYSGILISLIIFTYIMDIGTFLYAGFKNNLWSYEVNPIIVSLKLTSIGIFWSIFIAILFKTIIVVTLVWMLLKYNPHKTHIFAYLLVYGTLFAILIQGFGAFSNMYTSHLVENSITSGTPMPVALSDNQALNLGKIVSIVYYTLTALNLISFWVYEKIYRTKSYVS